MKHVQFGNGTIFLLPNLCLEDSKKLTKRDRISTVGCQLH